MFRACCTAAAAFLLTAGVAQAGWPLGFGRGVASAPPAPRIIGVAPYAGGPSAAAPGWVGPHEQFPAATAPGPRSPYPWGYFGARTEPGFVRHRGYYGDLMHWWQ